MRILNNTILDNEGRNLILRGVNLGGGSKVPCGPPGWGLGPESLKNPQDASFVGRPFPLEEAEAHFRRLARSGFTFCRLIVTWEALEHAGPGIYDEAYLAYIRKILLTAEQEGVQVFIDPHQDVWSRRTGGDGAPCWTLEALGMNLEALDASAAAITWQHYPEFHGGKTCPPMVWPSNYDRYATATMFSLFFGGNTFAPDISIEGEPVQEWLQGRYIAAFRHCYRRLKNCAAIAGWGVMNEPHYGFIGCTNIETAEKPMIPTGPRPSPWDTMRAASGYPVDVPVYGLISSRAKGRETLNPEGVSLFKPGYTCPWQAAGVWENEKSGPRLLRKDHFARFQGRPADFVEDFLKPFTIRFIEKMKEADENTFFFIEGLPHSSQAASHPSWGAGDPPNTINAFHWYDGLSLFTRSFRPWFTVDTDKVRIVLGRKKVIAYFTGGLAAGCRWTREKMGNMPCLLGEFGLAFDINKGKAKRKNRIEHETEAAASDYSVHEEALSMYYDAVDANLLHSTLWNYTADNTGATGDGWNGEDLSIFSEGTERAAAGWKRPYPMATAGDPLLIRWDRKRGIFRYRFRADSVITAPTVLYLPGEFFGASPQIKARPEAQNNAALRFEYNHEEQRLFVYNDGFSGNAEIEIAR